MRGGSKSGYPNKSVPASAPRGVKNNNPGNIRISGNSWRGKLKNNTDGSFEQFETMELGARAHIKNLQTYFKRGLDTVIEIVYAWAPPSDGNDSLSYANFVAKQILRQPYDRLEPSPELLVDLGYAMSKMENGKTKFITRKHYVDAFNII